MLRSYLLMTILGYFGVKIGNGVLRTLPYKDSSEEIPDMIATIVLGGVLYVLNNMGTRTLLSVTSTSTMMYYLAFAAGLTLPFAKSSMIDQLDDNTIKNVLYAIVASIVLASFYVSFTTQTGNVLNYLLYVMCIMIVLGGIIFTKSHSRTFPTTDKATGEKSMYTTVGQSINMSLPLFAWLVSLLFVADAEGSMADIFLSFMQGAFYGVFVGGVSLYGLSYLLKDTTSRKCVGAECQIDGMMVDDAPYNNLNSQVGMIKWVLGINVVVLMVIIILFYTSAAEFVPLMN